MRRRIKALFLENWTLKAIALFLALFLWIFVRGEQGPERVVTVPLEVRLPRQMEIINKRPTSIEVTMRGAPVSNLWFSQPLPACVIDLQTAGEGEHVVPLTPDHIKLSQGSGIEILQMNPTRITIVLEPTVSKEMPIAIPVRGEPAKGFEVYSKHSKPATVIISGPRSRISEMQEVQTAPISLEGRNQSNQFFAALNLKDSSIRTSIQDPVLIEVTIGPIRRLHTIHKVTVTVDNAAFSTTPKQIDIQVLAKPDSIPEITPMDFRVVFKTNSSNIANLPMRRKPVVEILNDFNGSLSIKAIHPSEVTLRRKQL
jgi:YbbR domain-containing protein